MNFQEQSKINKIEKTLNLPEINKDLPFKERLSEMFENKVLSESEDGKKYILQTLSRIAVIVNVNGVKIPFYQSSTGTGGKVSGAWYPFFGNKGAWLIKGDIEKDLNQGYHIPEIQEMMKYLNEVLPEYLYTNLLTPEQAEIFANATWKKQMGKVEKVKELYKEFIISPDESAEYMAKVLGYDLKSVPDEEDPQKLAEFMKAMLQSIKQKLAIFKKF
jgi:hypothetical protein